MPKFFFLTEESFFDYATILCYFSCSVREEVQKWNKLFTFYSLIYSLVMVSILASKYGPLNTIFHSKLAFWLQYSPLRFDFSFGIAKLQISNAFCERFKD